MLHSHTQALRRHDGRTPDRTRAVAVAAAAVVVADQATKALAPFAHNGAVLPMRNHDLLLGIVGGNRIWLAGLMAALLVGFGRHVMQRVTAGTMPPLAAGLLVGGALANLADRAVLGSVRDFIVIGHTIVVNVADLAVTIGLVIYLCARFTTRSATSLTAACEAPE